MFGYMYVMIADQIKVISISIIPKQLECLCAGDIPDALAELL